jgi:hypothetical protein
MGTCTVENFEFFSAEKSIIFDREYRFWRHFYSKLLVISAAFMVPEDGIYAAGDAGRSSD